ncbi:MAG: cupin domain-containing protein [Saprospiraceae bacterium]
MHHLTPTEALQQLAVSGKLFSDVFRHGSLVVEIYRPDKVDLQQPHTRDEIYVVVAGTGQFECNGVLTDFAPGDFLFVPAFAPHRFIDFSEDFATWVFFYGPEGGE